MPEKDPRKITAFRPRRRHPPSHRDFAVTTASRQYSEIEDRNGVAGDNEVTFAYSPALDQAPNTGVRKAVLLARYVRLIKAWIAAERQSAAAQAGATYDSTWERTSLPLTVSAAYQAQLTAFSAYFKSEMAAIGDATLAQEVTVLDKLAQ